MTDIVRVVVTGTIRSVPGLKMVNEIYVLPMSKLFGSIKLT